MCLNILVNKLKCYKVFNLIDIIITNYYIHFTFYIGDYNILSVYVGYYLLLF